MVEAGMSLTMITMIIIAVWIFRKGIFGLASFAENTIESVTNLSDDSIQTYARVVHTSNVKKRNELLDELLEMDTMVTINDIDSILNGTKSRKSVKEKEEETSTQPKPKRGAK